MYKQLQDLFFISPKSKEFHFLTCGLRRLNIHDEEKSLTSWPTYLCTCMWDWSWASDHCLNHEGSPTKRSKDKETQLLKIKKTETKLYWTNSTFSLCFWHYTFRAAINVTSYPGKVRTLSTTANEVMCWR